MENAIEIYQSKDGLTSIEVKFENETIWLTQSQMEELFEKEKRTISEHINNIFKEGELERNSTVRNFRIVQKDGNRAVQRTVYQYNLDVVISVGYRVKSLRGTQFRIWATQRLKDYLVKGYAINEKRLQEAESRFIELKKAVSLLDRVSKSKALSGDEAQGLQQVLNDYAFALDILDQYDHLLYHEGKK
ncbi:MAG: virulence RhuM family protein [Flavobacteriales bacterium]